MVGEFTSPEVDKLVGEVLNEYGNIFNIHAHAFIVDANAANSPSIKAFKAALSEIKSEIIDVSICIQDKGVWYDGNSLLTTYTLLLLKGREAKCANLLAENDIITPEGIQANLSYTLITQREPDHQVHPSDFVFLVCFLCMQIAHRIYYLVRQHILNICVLNAFPLRSL